MSGINKETIGLEWAQPIESHARLVMDWRNHPETLRWSFSQSKKTWGSFWDEFSNSYFLLKDIPPVFGLFKGQKVAFVRFRPYTLAKPGLSVDISINVDPQHRGKGLGKEILRLARDFAFERGAHNVVAEIKEGNSASIRAFESAGFTFLDEIQKEGKVLRFTSSKANLPKRSVFVIAEAGSNWRVGSAARDIKMAKALIDVAADARVDAVKFQTYRAKTVYVENAGVSDYLAEGGIKEDISSIFRDLEMPYEMLGELATYAKSKGIEFMSSPFSIQDFNAVDPFVSYHKLASYELSHLRLIEAMARSGKPTFMSTGAASIEDIAWAVKTFKSLKGGPLTLMQCTAKYPAGPSSMNLLTLQVLTRLFSLPVGLSDHSMHPVHGPLMAVALGATAIEKHFTLHRRLPGPDHYFALTPQELKELVEAVRVAEAMRGDRAKVVLESEHELARYAKRALQARTAISQGDLFEEGKNIDILRPGNQRPGVHPKHLPEILGRGATRDIPLGDGIQLGDW